METDISPELKLKTAFAKAQGAFEVPKKTKQYLIQNKPVKYADLADVIEAVRKALSENGLSITHQIGYTDEKFGLTTTLMHAAGASILTWYPLPDISKQNIRPQEFGGALTYARRYSVSSILGIASDEDDDGATAPVMEQQKPAPKPTPAVKPPTGSGVIRTPITKSQGAGIVDQPPPDDFDQRVHEVEHLSEPVTMLDELVALAESRNIPNEEMSTIIKRVIGRAERAKNLTSEELSKVVNFVKLYGPESKKKTD